MIYLLPVKEKYIDYGEYKSVVNYKFVNVKEKWKTLYFKGLPTKYKVSNLGNIRRPDGNLAQLYYDKNGYTRFCLYIPKNDDVFKNKKAIRYPYKTHRAVAELFIKNHDPKNKTLVMHKNDIPDCNIYLNLQWGSPKNNMDDKKTSGRSRYLKGSEKPDSYFTEEDARNVCDCLYKYHITNKSDIMHFLGYDECDETTQQRYRNLIANIKRKHCWKFIIDEYD